ncbi:MAG: HlyD family type I secretion periplasmic adaptor subunit [Desulfotignum sp.]|nr:HlyD family type I secretion periplasmic adaptor subunit [Desulfotignum sp.]MCF8113619.1 HlyD family type I secretion periplasmic adaptor subunit [Desulfotignum sp.]MCF8125870.1 HlyD family type I secretion periplasmic adaptor subunit [Desulfotignum sp.]
MQHLNETFMVSRTTHLFFVLLIFMCAAFVAWSYIGTLDIVSIAQGKVVPSGKIKHIQHFEGGIVHGIKVKEGDAVSAGQPLVELEQIRSGASLEEIQMRIDALKVDVYRYEAQLHEKKEPVFPPDIKKQLPVLVKEAKLLFDIQKQNRQNTVNKLQTVIHQREQRIKSIQSRLSNKLERLPLLEEELALSEDLYKDNLTTRFKHINIMRQVKEIQGEIAGDRSALTEARHALKESQENLEETLSEFKEKTSERLKEATQELKELSARLKKFKDNLDRTIIRSPINGVVKKLYVVTRGGVVKPGDTIVDIVPSEEKLIIEAHLDISDIGYIKKDQLVFLQLPSRDARKFNKIEGKVINVSPDTFTDPQGQTFYNVRIESEKSYFSADDQEYRLYPGMVLLAYIHIGKRTVFEYLVDPFINTLSFSLQER